MVKDESSSFFLEEAKLKTSDTANPDIMLKWVGVAEKGINLVDQLIKMRSSGKSKGGGETSAYEKGLSRGLAQLPAPTPAPTPAPIKAITIYKSDEAVEYLIEALEKTDQTKTLKEYIEGDLTEAKKSGILKIMVEEFFKTFVEVKQ